MTSNISGHIHQKIEFLPQRLELSGDLLGERDALFAERADGVDMAANALDRPIIGGGTGRGLGWRRRLLLLLDLAEIANGQAGFGLLPECHLEIRIIGFGDFQEEGGGHMAVFTDLGKHRRGQAQEPQQAGDMGLRLADQDSGLLLSQPLVVDQLPQRGRDLEGMEIDVLRGAAKTIKAHRPLIYMECQPDQRSQSSLKLLKSMGYATWWHGDIGSPNILGAPLERPLSVMGLKLA